MESAEGTEECHKNTVRYALSRPALEVLTREPTCWIQYRNNGRRLLEDLVHTTHHSETQLSYCPRLPVQFPSFRDRRAL